MALCLAHNQELSVQLGFSQYLGLAQLGRARALGA